MYNVQREGIFRVVADFQISYYIFAFIYHFVLGTLYFVHFFKLTNMEIIIICFAALIASALTFFSGFGLGTIMLPVFALFFPVDVAVALTGVVHFTNNLFKITLVGKNTDKTVFLRFGIPAIIASFIGAWLLIRITEMPVLYEYILGNRTMQVTPVKLIVAVLLIIFAFVEIIPSIQHIKFEKDKLPYGGFLSGFFGGLTGMQGAIRSAFLLKAGLTKEAYIATGVAIACVIDISRLSVYASRFTEANLTDNLALLFVATSSAIIGAVLGNKLLKKITMKSIQLIVAVLLIIISVAMGSGLI